MKRILLLALALYTTPFVDSTTQSQSPTSAAFDVIHYNLTLEPDIDRKSLTGKETIRLAARVANLTEIEFSCGDLTIDSVREKGTAQQFVRRDRRLIITLSKAAQPDQTRELEIDYHGAPRRGIRFFPERQQVYTIFSTSQWMVAVDEPDARPEFLLSLVLPPKQSAVGNGSPMKPSPLPNGKIVHTFLQGSPIPTYIFGFAVGNFRAV